MKTVRIVADEISSSVRVYDEESGTEIRGLRDVQISMKLDDIVLAKLEIGCAKVDVKGAVPEFYAVDPHSWDGEVKRVRRIEFADGSVREF